MARWLVGLLVLFSCSVTPGFGWSQEELDLFDLVEEIGENFYHLMQVNEDASNAEIRRAYRQLSLQLHPDKSDDPDAAEKFSKMVAVSDVLKDEELRQIYDQILVDGLPDWKQPLFYYRRMRKMGLLELGLLLFLMMSVAHYLYGWAVFAEKQIVLQDVLSRKLKKDQKKSRNTKSQQTRQRLHAEVEMISAQAQASIPHLKDLLPVILARNCIWLLVLGWRVLRGKIERWHEKSEEGEEKEEGEGEGEGEVRMGGDWEGTEEEGGDWEGTEEEGGEEGEKERVEMRDGKEQKEDNGAVNTAQCDVQASSTADCSESVTSEICPPPHHGTGNVTHLRSGKEISSEQATSPDAQVPRQTEAAFLGVRTSASQEESLPAQKTRPRRTLERKAKKSARIMDLASSQERTTAGTLQLASEGNVSHEHPAGRSDDRCERPGTNTVLGTVPNSGSQAWSQFQQKQLEWALARYPKYSEQRWENIAKSVPGKSQEECMERCKQIYAELKHKKRTNIT